MDEVFIRVRTADRGQLRLAVSLHSSVAQLKEQLSDRFKLPPARQKLIYQGRLLRDEERLEACRIQTDHVIQLVAAVPTPAPSLPPLPEPSPAQFRMEIRTTVPGMIRRRREEPVNGSARESRLEAMHQNLISLENLVACHTATGFDLTRRTLVPGQWVDALDTVNQWLEAQVMDVRDSRALIHYIGWPSGWDEWIVSESPRLQVLGSKTAWRPRQFRPMCAQSPCPHALPDSRAVLSPLELAEAVRRAGRLLPILHSLLRRPIDPDTGEALSTLLDRAGRLLSDLGGLLDGGELQPGAMATSAELAQREDTGLSLSVVFQSRE